MIFCNENIFYKYIYFFVFINSRKSLKEDDFQGHGGVELEAEIIRTLWKDARGGSLLVLIIFSLPSYEDPFPDL